MDRNNIVKLGLDLKGLGVEFGPLNNPIVLKSEGPILYVDYADTETVKSKPYDSSINPDDIVDIDIVWGASDLKSHGIFKYAIASHVIEHIPDPIGWIVEILDALDEDGLISLVIPDKRYTFDINRPLTTTGQLIEAWLKQSKQPSIAQVFDNCNLGVEIDKVDAWMGNTANLPPLVGDVALEFAYKQAVEISKSPRYIDSHCWIFTPDSFLAIVKDLARLNIWNVKIEYFTATQPGSFEFFVKMKNQKSHNVPSI